MKHLSAALAALFAATALSACGEMPEANVRQGPSVIVSNPNGPLTRPPAPLPEITDVDAATSFSTWLAFRVYGDDEATTLLSENMVFMRDPQACITNMQNNLNVFPSAMRYMAVCEDRANGLRYGLACTKPVPQEPTTLENRFTCTLTDYVPPSDEPLLGGADDESAPASTPPEEAAPVVTEPVAEKETGNAETPEPMRPVEEQEEEPVYTPEPGVY